MLLLSLNASEIPVIPAHSLPALPSHIYTHQGQTILWDMECQAVEFPAATPLEHFLGHITQIWRNVPLENRP